MDEMRAELELAKSSVGDTVQVAHNPVSTPARKVCLVPLVRQVPDSIWPQRQKAVATATVLSVPLPAHGDIVTVFTGHSHGLRAG